MVVVVMVVVMVVVVDVYVLLKATIAKVRTLAAVYVFVCCFFVQIDPCLLCVSTGRG